MYGKSNNINFGVDAQSPENPYKRMTLNSSLNSFDMDKLENIFRYVTKTFFTFV